MHPGCECSGINESLTDADGRTERRCLPVCGEDNRLKGIITDRDIVVKCIAKGKNPAEVKVGDLVGEARVWWLDTGADVDEVLHQMAEHKIRRLPVLENKELVSISQADLAAKLPEDKVGELVGAIPSASQSRTRHSHQPPRAQGGR